MSTETTTTTPAKAPVQITISAVQEMLAQGHDREAIRLHFGLNKADLKRVFMNPKLKGKKVKKSSEQKAKFVLVDDTDSATTETATSTPTSSEETTTPATESTTTEEVY